MEENRRSPLVFNNASYMALKAQKINESSFWHLRHS